MWQPRSSISEMPAVTTALAVVCGVLGLSVGSFLNVVIYRIPRHESCVRPGSRCPRCATSVRPLDNLPVVSWVILRGRCRSCRQPISARYLVVEMLTAILFASMALRFGAVWELPAYLVGFASLLALSVMAAEHGWLRGRAFWATLVVTGALLALAAAMQSQWRHMGDAIVGAFGAWIMLRYWGPAGSRVRSGDLRLAPLAGGLMGFLGIEHVLFGLWSAAVLALLWQAGSLIGGARTAYDGISLGPLVAGCAVVITLVGESVVSGS